MPPKSQSEQHQSHPYVAAEAPYRLGHAITPYRTSLASQPASNSANALFTSIANCATNAHATTMMFIAAYWDAIVDHPHTYSRAPLSPSTHGSEDIRANNNSPNSNDSSGTGNTNSNSSTTASTGTSRTSAGSPPGLPASTSAAVSKSAPTSVSKTESLCISTPAPMPSSRATSATPAFDAQQDASFYETLMEEHVHYMPPPGLGYYHARRSLWLTCPPDPPAPLSPAPSRVKLEALLNQPGAVESDEVWKAGLKNVWKGLVGGSQLRKRLPLSIVLKILQAGWLRDGTWPEGAVAPPWDDQLHQQQQQQQPHQQQYSLLQLQRQSQSGRPGPSGPIASPSNAQLQHANMHGVYMYDTIPPGYSPSSGDQPEQTYAQPYAYALPTPPPNAPVPPHPQYSQYQQPQGHTHHALPDISSVRVHEDADDVDDDDDELDDDELDDADVLLPRSENRDSRTGDGRLEGG